MRIILNIKIGGNKEKNIENANIGKFLNPSFCRGVYPLENPIMP